MAACLRDETGDGSRGRLTRVALIGHSYVRRMADVMEQDLRWFNLGLNSSVNEVEVRSFHRGGATVRLMRDDRWIHCHLQRALLFRPDIIYLHIGENDLNYVEAPQLADQISALMSYIRSVSHPRVLIVSQLIWFPCNEQLHGKITQINAAIKHSVSQLNDIPAAPGCRPTQFVYMQHQFGVWSSTRVNLFLPDRVHLNPDGMKRYLWSVHNCIGRFV